MKIRPKLILLVSGIVVAMGTAAGVYAALMTPVNKIRGEKEYIIALADAIKAESFVVSRLPFLRMNDGPEQLKAASAATAEAFKGLDRIKTLPKVNAEVKEALEVLRALAELNGKREEKLESDYTRVMEDAQKTFVFIDSVTPMRFYDNDVRLNKNRAELVKASLPDVQTFLTGIDILCDSLQSSVGTISEKYSMIDGEIRVAGARATKIALIIAALVVAATLAASMTIANAIARSVIAAGKGMVGLAEGDLTGRAASVSKDEVGAMAGSINAVLELFSQSVSRIKEISAANVEVKDRLVSAADEASSAGTEIEANTRSIEKQIGNLDSRVDESAEAVGKIAEDIAELNGKIEDEGGMVERASSSVTRMLDSLESVGRTMEQERESARLLVSEAEHGKSVFSSSSAKIAEITASVGVIRDMADVIKTLASQTNLLAMNAAIEAAHAGEVGGGFAVVADEIRRLSEASSKSSREISDSIKRIVSSMSEASAADADVQGAFAAIDRKIREVGASIEEMSVALRGIGAGGSEVLDAMGGLGTASDQVKGRALSIERGSSGIKSAMDDLTRISSEVRSNISEISQGIADIHTSIQSVASLSDQVAGESARLDAEVKKFRTEVSTEAEVEVAAESSASAAAEAVQGQETSA